MSQTRLRRLWALALLLIPLLCACTPTRIQTSPAREDRGDIPQNVALLLSFTPRDFSHIRGISWEGTALDLEHADRSGEDVRISVLGSQEPHTGSPLGLLLLKTESEEFESQVILPDRDPQKIPVIRVGLNYRSLERTQDCVESCTGPLFGVAALLGLILLAILPEIKFTA